MEPNVILSASDMRKLAELTVLLNTFVILS